MKILKAVFAVLFKITVVILSLFVIAIVGMMAYRKTEQNRRT